MSGRKESSPADELADSLRIRLESKDAPAVKAALGQEGVVMDSLLVGRAASSGSVGGHHRVRFFRKRHEAQETLAVLKRIGDIFLSRPDDEMFNDVLKVILEVMRSPFGVFGYIDENEALVVPSLTRPIRDESQVSDKTIIFPRDKWGDGSWSRAVREKRPHCSNEISTETPEGRNNLKRHLSLPILFQGEAIGLFQVADKKTDYTEMDVRTLERIAEYVAPVLSARLRRQRYEEELQKKNDELTRFMYAVSHDLKSPLVTIQTFLGFLGQDARKPGSEGLDKDLMYIRTAADKMSRLLDELLELSRIGHKAHPSGETPLQAIVKEALDAAAGRIAERGVKVEVTEEPLLLYGDRPRLVEVFQNLVDNAVKFMGDEPAPLVEIGAEQNGDKTVLFVRDNGIGIAPQYQPKLFGLFEKLDPGTEGAGIGLALVRRIVEIHGGRIWVESEGLGQGAAFRFTLAKTRLGRR
jgi:signal transduction histidine kinase